MSPGRMVAVGAVGLVSLIAVVGCGKDLSGFSTVSGVITHNGTPVEGARVEFHSNTESGGQRDSFSTTTDSAGKYMIAGVGKAPGIPPGMYKVAVAKLNMKAGANLPKDYDAGQVDAQASATGGTSMVLHLLPKDYASPATSKLSATIEPGKNQDVNFDLKGKAGQ